MGNVTIARVNPPSLRSTVLRYRGMSWNTERDEIATDVKSAGSSDSKPSAFLRCAGVVGIPSRGLPIVAILETSEDKVKFASFS